MTIVPPAPYKRIATEEAFITPEVVAASRSLIGRSGDPGFESIMGFFLSSTAARPKAVLERLLDLDARRIADMDAAGIDLSLTSP